MVMSLSFLAKVKLIRRVAVPPSQQAKSSSSTTSSSSSKEPRRALLEHPGAIVALEGDDVDATNEVKTGIISALTRMDDFDIHVWDGPRLPGKDATIVDFMGVVQEWHGKREEMMRILRGELVSDQVVAEQEDEHDSLFGDDPDTQTERREESEHMDVAVDEDSRKDSAVGSTSTEILREGPRRSTAGIDENYDDDDDDDANVPIRRDLKRKSSLVSVFSSHHEHDLRQAPSSRVPSLAHEADHPPSGVPPSARKKPKVSPAAIPRMRNDKIPLLIIPHYILSACNAWSAALPILDAYLPADHWQWIATLFRGVIGADFTIYVRSSSHPSHEDHRRGPEPQTPGGANIGKDGGAPGKATVEIREELGALVIRMEADVNKGKVGLDNGAVRRCAFEVGEWVRGLSARIREGQEQEEGS
jgi:HMG box factor, other